MFAPNPEVQPNLRPLLVSVRKARELLGGCGHNKFWALVKVGEIELIGSSRKRWVTLASLDAYVARQLKVAKAEGPSTGPRTAKVAAQATR
jgi:hypothetical protein